MELVDTNATLISVSFVSVVQPVYTNTKVNNVIPNLKWIVPLCLDMCVIGSSYNQIIIR